MEFRAASPVLSESGHPKNTIRRQGRRPLSQVSPRFTAGAVLAFQGTDRSAARASNRESVHRVGSGVWRVRDPDRSHTSPFSCDSAMPKPAIAKTPAQRPIQLFCTRDTVHQRCRCESPKGDTPPPRSQFTAYTGNREMGGGKTGPWSGPRRVHSGTRPPTRNPPAFCRPGTPKATFSERTHKVPAPKRPRPNRDR